MNCANCGADLELDGSTQTPVCAFCKHRNLVPEDVWRRFHPVESPVAHAPVASPQEKKDNLTLYITLGGVGVAAAMIAILLVATHDSKTSPTKSGDDRAFAEPNSACGTMKAACSTDHKSLLHCDGQKLVPALACKGPKGCRPTHQGESVSCDYTYADENDPCNVTDSACSTDKKRELKCDGNKFVVSSACGGPDGCTVALAADGYTLTCDDHLAAENAPCLEDGRMACSLDSQSLLRCTRGHFVVASACAGPKRCALEKNAANDTTSVDCDRGKR